MKEAINYVITRMAAERGITLGQMHSIIEDTIHRSVTSSDSVLRGELMTWFGSKEPSVEEFIEAFAKMIDIAHHHE